MQRFFTFPSPNASKYIWKTLRIRRVFTLPGPLLVYDIFATLSPLLLFGLSVPPFAPTFRLCFLLGLFAPSPCPYVPFLLFVWTCPLLPPRSHRYTHFLNFSSISAPSPAGGGRPPSKRGGNGGAGDLTVT